MKKQTILAALCLAALVGGPRSVAAANVTVSTVDELTNALLTAAGGTRIVLKAGVYDVSSLTPRTPKEQWGGSVTDIAPAYLLTKTSLILAGENATSWRTKTPAQESVIRCTNAQASLFYGYAGGGRGSTFYHLTFEGGDCSQVATKDGGNNGGAIHFNDASVGFATNCVFRNCRAGNGGGTYAVSVYDCLYTNCTATVQAGGAYAHGANIAYHAPTNVVANCVFLDCSAPQGGGVYTHELQDYGTPTAGRISGCAFTNCTASIAGGAIYATRQGLIDGCDFFANASPSGAVCSAGIYSGLITNCTFVANAATGGKVTMGGAVCNWVRVGKCVFDGNASTASDSNAAAYGGAVANVKDVANCVFTNNTAATSGGAAYKSTVRDSLFVTNCVTGSRGGACSYVTASNCFFTGNYSKTNRGGAADASTLTDCVLSNNYVGGSARGGAACYSSCRGCRFSGAGDVSGGTLVNCVFDGVTRTPQTPNFIIDAAANGKATLAATNCLFTHCTAMQIANNAGSKMDLVNCTFADNTLTSWGNAYMVYAFADINYSDVTRPLMPGTTRVYNCIFSGNKNMEKKDVDFQIAASNLVTATGVPHLYITNALWTAGSAVSGNVETSGVIQASPRFVGTASRHYPNAAPYMIKPSSPARNRGCTIAWPKGMTDVEGNPRVEGSAVDLGCYECNLPFIGSAILVK